jgi:hypothetical protein
MSLSPMSSKPPECHLNPMFPGHLGDEGITDCLSSLRIEANVVIPDVVEAT